MGSALTRRSVVLGKIQTAEGVAATPVPATDGLLISDLTYTVDGEVVPRNFLRDALSPLPHRIGRKLFECTFGFELKSGSGLGVAPEWSPLMRAAGMQETVSAGVDVEYVFRDTGHEFATFDIYPDGLLLHCVDSIVDITGIQFNAGGIAICSARLRSAYATPTDVPLPAGVVYDSHVPAIAESMLFTMGGFAVGVLPSFNINFANQLSERRDVNSPFGYKGTRYTGRAPAGTMTLEQETAAIFPAFTHYASAAVLPWSASLGTSPNKITFSSPGMVFSSVRSGDANGIRTLDIGFNLTQPALIKELTITCE